MRQFRSNRGVFGCESATDPTALALHEPRREAAENDARNENHKSHLIERNSYREVRIGRIERVEGHCDGLMIRDRERHQHDESRGHDDCPYEPALHRPRAPIDRYAWRTDRFKAPPGIRLTDTLQSHFAAISVCVRLRRSRISLPVLKNGTD